MLYILNCIAIENGNAAYVINLVFKSFQICFKTAMSCENLERRYLYDGVGLSITLGFRQIHCDQVISWSYSFIGHILCSWGSSAKRLDDWCYYSSIRLSMIFVAPSIYKFLTFSLLRKQQSLNAVDEQRFLGIRLQKFLLKWVLSVLKEIRRARR